jgi:hypothetical protein
LLSGWPRLGNVHVILITSFLSISGYIDIKGP